MTIEFEEEEDHLEGGESESDDPFGADDDEEDLYRHHAYSNQIGSRQELKPGERYSPKIAPAWGGIGSWFDFENDVLDWLDVTVVAANHIGPALKNNLMGAMTWYKRHLKREKLRDITELDETAEKPEYKYKSVEYFMTEMHKLTMRGNYPFFLSF